MLRSLAKSAIVRYSAGLLAWGAGVLLVLQLGKISTGQFSHAICGPWGCGPPVESLLAYHGFWLMLMLPPSLVYDCTADAQRVRRWGIAVTLFAVCGLAGLMGWTTYRWLPHDYLVQHVLFVVATSVDVPLVQLAVVGLAAWCIGRRRQSGRLTSETATNRRDPPVATDDIVRPIDGRDVEAVSSSSADADSPR